MDNQITITDEAKIITTELCEIAKLKVGDLMVIGCSSSEIIGSKIGTCSSEYTANEVFTAIYSTLRTHGIELAAQCCEHLNRMLIVERAVAEQFNLEIVNAIPQPKAGGSFATAAYANFIDPVAVESIKQNAKAGIDIGGTLIGMHIKPVVVPVRLSISKIGHAPIICARYRPKFVGGIRAMYDDNLL